MSVHCLHQWEPIPMKCGRYRCPQCGVAGYQSGCGVMPYKNGKLPSEVHVLRQPTEFPSTGRRVSQPPLDEFPELPDPEGWIEQ